MSKVFKIIPTTQQYDWGKQGRQSKVFQLAVSSQIPSFQQLDESKPYAELWMGTHPTSPSHVSTDASSSVKLSEHLKKHPELIGNAVSAKFPDGKEGNLPFLFKVLSIQKALSIQTHPDKPTAEKLHAERPDIYKDPNHKPELALALTPFRALCGFQPLPNIAHNLQNTPELAALIPSSILDAFLQASGSHWDGAALEAKQALRDLFAAIMTVPKEEVTKQVRKLVERYQATSDAIEKEMVLRLNEQFPDDIGILCVFLLNHVTLQPGEAIFLGAGEPHAYVDGDIIECMANSDNVIRAGLTPKLIDVPNLVSGLTYVPGEPGRHKVTPSSFPESSQSSASTLYDPPIPEFSVVQVKLKGSQESHPAVPGPSIVVVVQGQGTVKWEGDRLEIKNGDVFFIGADTGVEFASTGGDELVMYRAYVVA
ncbi:Mannose-6-phosphate isomerase [Marasmius crinis-equi]|uniref:Mannose-6-phosphate isomerase n=1 Tax=Marasmius crinis-equi TaxID=585013 RepID=A0ABR3FX55_9AGAR